MRSTGASAYAHHFADVAGVPVFFPGPWQRGRVLQPGDDALLANLLHQLNRWRLGLLISAFIIVMVGITAWMIHTRGRGGKPDPVLLFVLFFSLRFAFVPVALMLRTPARTKIAQRRGLGDFWRAQAPAMARRNIVRLVVVGVLLFGLNAVRWQTTPHTALTVVRVVASLGLGTFMLAKAAVVMRARRAGA